MKHSSRVWRYQQHMLTVKAISYYSVLMCGTSHAEDCGVRWMIAVADFCGGAARVGCIALQLAFWKGSLKLWFLCSCFVSCILYDTYRLKVEPINTGSSFHVRNIIYIVWYVLTMLLVVISGWLKSPWTKIIPQWMTLHPNDKKQQRFSFHV